MNDEINYKLLAKQMIEKHEEICIPSEMAYRLRDLYGTNTMNNDLFVKNTDFKNGCNSAFAVAMSIHNCLKCRAIRNEVDDIFKLEKQP